MPDARKLFETLVREHADMLSIYLRSALGNTTDVDDLFQETMIIAWRRLDDFDHSQPFGPWLRGIARKLLLAHDRKRSRWLCDSEMLNHIESRLSSLNHPSVSSWEERLEVLRQCVESLPDVYRQAVGMKYFEQQAIQQVSDALGLTVAAVKKRLQRARSLVLDCVTRKLSVEEML